MCHGPTVVADRLAVLGLPAGPSHRPGAACPTRPPPSSSGHCCHRLVASAASCLQDVPGAKKSKMTNDAGAPPPGHSRQGHQRRARALLYTGCRQFCPASLSS